MIITPQQDQALKAVSAWYKDPHGAPFFYLGGYAGTGKTTLAKHFAASINGVSFCAFTGKAALVMRQKGCVGASTIHSLIYTFDTEAPLGTMRFIRNALSPLLMANLVIVDECSMVNCQLGEDLLSFGKKVLVLGDPAQLPPVEGAGFFTLGEPDFLLTEIHRQAAENPIIRLSQIVREGGKLKQGKYGDSAVIPQSKLDWQALAEHDQVLVGMNRTRQTAIAKIRELRGRTLTVEKDDRLICLKNDRQKMLLNGSMWTVLAVREYGRSMRLTLSSQDGLAEAVDIYTRPEMFDGREDTLSPAQRRNLDEFTFAEAITVHKAQGSQWNDVAIIDESRQFREDARAHLYTAITRAASRVLVVVPQAASSLGGI